MTEICVDSLVAALEAARELKEQDYCVFRGQISRWPVLPSLWRVSLDERARAQLRLHRFAKWSEQFGDLPDSKDGLTAIAQHHGVATPFLDVTMSPEIAAFFAQDGAAEGEGVIMAWRREDIETMERLRLVELDVPNLWRLEAQQGAFLVAEDEDALQALRSAAIIRFPHSGDAPAGLPERTAIYPERVSELEVRLGEFFNRLRQIENDDIASGYDNVDVMQVYAWTPRQSAYKWFSPPTGEGWMTAMAQSSGVIAPRERLDAMTQIQIKAPGPGWGGDIKRHFLKTIHKLERNADQFLGPNAPRPDWKLGFINANVRQRHEMVLNDLSDHMRFMDIDSQDWARAHALFIAATRKAQGDDGRATAAVGELLGEVVDIELRGTGGARHFGMASVHGLSEVYDAGVINALSSYEMRKSDDDPLRVVDIGVHPAHIFKYDGFQRLLAREIAPLIAVNEACYRPDDSEPERRFYGGLPSLRGVNVSALSRRGDFKKPFHIFDPQADAAIYLFGDMTQSDIAELGACAIRSISGGRGQMQFIRLLDYDDDEGLPIWRADPRCQEHAQAFIQAGGLVTLQPTTSFQLGDTPTNRRADANGSPGWGGLEIVALAQGVCDQVFSGDASAIEAVRQSYKELYKQTMNILNGKSQGSA